ncbi:MAG: ATP-binding cassette domain-containing protein, partial [Nitrospiraceae bacterium]
MAEVVLGGVSKRVGTVEIIASLTLTVREGEFFSIVGPSGSGKSTLLHLIAGLETPTAGQILFDGQNVTTLPPRERDVALVFQNYALYPYMTVWENVALPLVMRRLSTLQRLPLIGNAVPGSGSVRAGINRDVLQTCEGLGLVGLLERKPAQLSG